MGRRKRIRRSAAVWRQLFSRQSDSGLSAPEFCQREGINASLFRRWRATLTGAAKGHRMTARAELAAETPVPFIDLGDRRSDLLVRWKLSESANARGNLNLRLTRVGNAFI